MIDGISIAGYRSFGSEEVRISDLAQVNVFIGRNNCGKSNILRFVELFEQLAVSDRAGPGPELHPTLDYHLAEASKVMTVGLQLKHGGRTAQLFQSVTEPFGAMWAKRFPEYADRLWMSFKLLKGQRRLQPTDQSVKALAALILDRFKWHETNELTRVLCGYTGATDEKRAADISQKLHASVSPQIKVHLIDAFRKITDSGDDVLSGAGLISELRKLQSPDLANYESGKNRFAKITRFLQVVLGEPKALLEIPAEANEIYVSFDQRKVLPLESLGTGIHELIIMAAAVTLVDDVVFCIEEPEIHLHPALQKKFVQYIQKNTNNQYLIASHSHAFLDLEGVNVYRCWLDEGRTKCQLASKASDKHLILKDLGYRPSDLLHANFVIWVEGPSDRIHLNHWISSAAPELAEGLHYAIMFYGGRLLAHLAYEDPLVKDFVQLACLNRNACIVMDSDKRKPQSPLNDTKKRVWKDFEDCGCRVWVTAGRTIENYVAAAVLDEAVKEVHPKAHAEIKWERYADMTRLRKQGTYDKVRVARAVAARPTDWGVLDLRKAIDGLVEEIRKHNA